MEREEARASEQRADFGRAATLADVARAAGVSTATASKALNDRFDVSVSTRSRVLAVAKELGFTPNLQALSLMTSRTGTVGLLSTDIEGRFVLPILLGVEEELEKGGMLAVLANTRGSMERRDRQLTAMLGRRVDAIVVIDGAPEPVAPLERQVPVPVVYAYGPSTSADDMSVVCGDEEGGRLAAEHLMELGCRRIAHISGPTAPWEIGHRSSLARARGVSAAVAAAGLTLAGGAPIIGEWTEQWGWTAAAGLLDSRTPFDGLVCADDRIARGALDLLATRGVDVPGQVKVIGFDDWLALAPSARLPQSSVNLGLPAIGAIAARVALDPSTFTPGITHGPSHVVARESTIGRPA